MTLLTAACCDLQEAYEKECRSVFDALQALDERLASQRYLIENLEGGALPALLTAGIYL